MKNHPDRYRKHLIASAPDSPPKTDPAPITTYWLQHQNRFVATVRAPRGLPAQTVRFLAANQHAKTPISVPEGDTPSDTHRRILASRVKIYNDHTTDLFAETVQEVA